MDNEPTKFEKVGDIVSIFQRGRRWYANFQHDGKQHRPSLKTTNKKEARRKATVLAGKIIDGHYAKTTKAPTIEHVTTAYLRLKQSEGREKKTLEKTELVIGRMLDLASRRKAKTILDIGLEFIDAYRAEGCLRKPKPAAPKTMHNEIVLVRQIVNYALSRELIHIDPLRHLKLAKVRSKPQPFWIREEVEKILAAAKPPHQWSLIVLAETGMRVGELKWLTWDDVDFERGVIHIRAKDGWKPKTGEQRVIPLPTAVRQLLQEVPRRWHWVLTAKPSDTYPLGDHQISERRLLHYLKPIIKRLGLRSGHVHTLRHSFISDALTKGTPEAVLRSWVGHLDPEVTKIYTHIADTASQTAMQRLADAHQRERKTPESPKAADSDSAQSQHNTEDDQNGERAN